MSDGQPPAGGHTAVPFSTPPPHPSEGMPAAAFDIIGSFRPKTGSMDAWNAAYVRVEDYLRAHRIHNRLHQSRLIQSILERAARRHEAEPNRAPTEIAAEEIDAVMRRWFAETLGVADEQPERTAAEGRLALLLCDGPQKWPYAFLDEQAMPPDFKTAMRTGAIEAGPDLEVSSMVPRPIDLGPIPEAAGETIERIEDWPIVRTLLLWVFFAACLAAIFKMTR